MYTKLRGTSVLRLIIGILAVLTIFPTAAHGYNHNNHLHAARCVRLQPLNAFRSSSNRFIPPLMEEKLAQGQITPNDLERMFGLTESDVEVSGMEVKQHR
jgi:hypothetical protein